MDINWLVEKYQEKIVLVDKKRPVLEVIQEQIDVKEVPIETLTPIHLQFSMENVMHSIDYVPGHAIILHLYEVPLNEKSKVYYENIKIDTTYLSYFEEKTVYMIVEDTIGIIETNSNLLFVQVQMARGITHEELADRNLSLLEYLSTLDQLATYSEIDFT